jgi:hypothetical protein
MTRRTTIALALAVPSAVMLVTQVFAWEGGYFQWHYVLPIAVLVPWLPILRSRGERLGHRVLLLDGIVCLVAAARIFSPVVPISGHALFLTYTFLTIRNRWYRLASGAAFLQAAWLKVFVWNESGSFVGGLLVGSLLAAPMLWQPDRGSKTS